MAKYQVTHTCGHTATVDLVETASERERRLSWLETVPCMDCKRSADQTARDAENAASAEANASQGLPTLTGSEKQVAWAETIRSQAATAWDERLAIAAENRLGFSAASQLELMDALHLLRSEALSSPEARFWIDGRDRHERAVDAAQKAIVERGLAPGAMAEYETIMARMAAEKEDAAGRLERDAQAVLADEPSWVVEKAGSHWQATSLGKVVKTSFGYGSVDVDGKTLTGATGVKLYERVKAVGFAIAARAEAEKSAAVSATLAGATVVKVAKTTAKDHDYKLTLSDGRVVEADEEFAPLSIEGQRSRPAKAHPEAVRIAAEAKALRGSKGKAGAR